MQVAVRKPSKGTSIALWQHEFFAVNTRKCRGNTAKQEVDIYQALEFRKGSDMPEECRAGLSDKKLEAIWGSWCVLCPSVRYSEGKWRAAKGQVYISER